MNRMFDQMFGDLARMPQRQLEGVVTEWSPAIDVVTKNEDLVIRAELPGVRQEDVDIRLQDNVLTISGERKADREQERAGYHVRECRHGSFSRSLTLPQGTDENKIRARYEDGVLEVTVEGAGAIQEEPRRILDRGLEQLGRR
jgi:HSP20 family protein